MSEALAIGLFATIQNVIECFMIRLQQMTIELLLVLELFQVIQFRLSFLPEEQLTSFLVD